MAFFPPLISLTTQAAMLVKIYPVAVRGVDAYEVEIEVNAIGGYQIYLLCSAWSCSQVGHLGVVCLVLPTNSRSMMRVAPLKESCLSRPGREREAKSRPSFRPLLIGRLEARARFA